jgi:hypothetical protein
VTGAFAAFVLLALVAGLVWIANKSATRTDPWERSVQIDLGAVERKDRPFLAIWQATSGMWGEPFLRIAIWEDGTIWFAKDPTTWSHALYQGQIPADRIALLKEDILKTDVFDLKGYCYLGLDDDVDCLMLNFGGKTQMLYWNERDDPNFGINFESKPHHMMFKECWKMVNKLALNVIPARSEPTTEEFRGAPASWLLKRSIQSE